MACRLNTYASNPYNPLSCGTPCCAPIGPTGRTGPQGPQGVSGATGSIILSGKLYKGYAANSEDQLLDPPDTSVSGFLGLVICTGQLLAWDAVLQTYMVTTQPDLPFYFYDISSKYLYYVTQQSTPTTCTGAEQLTCADVTMFIDTLSGDIYFCSGNEIFNLDIPLGGPQGFQGFQGIIGWQGVRGFQGFQGLKSFIIDHPTNPDKYLVHACLEGPEAGVYYRGKGEITHDEIRIVLPHYVSALATDFTVQITPVRSEKRSGPALYETSDVIDGAFTVYGSPGKFFWHVYGSRAPVDVEPDRSSVEVKGSGPYKWI